MAGEEYRVLVLPSMRAVRHSTLEKAVEFHRAGGVVVVLGESPRASERAGDDDPQVLAMAAGLASTAAKTVGDAVTQMDRAFPRDFHCAVGSAEQPSVLHRKAGVRDVYMVYNAAKGAECTFRTTGKIELWDPWTGNTSELNALSQTSGSTVIRMPLENTEAQVIVFGPGRGAVGSVAAVKPAVLPLDGNWTFELKPTLDNRFGDYRLPATPAFIGPEARRFRYREEGPDRVAWSDPKLDDSKWAETTYSYGPRFWRLGPIPAGIDTEALEKRLAALKSVDAASPVEFGGKQYRWTPYEFSMRWGVEDDPGHQGYHGLKAEMPNDFIALGRMETKATTTMYVAEEGGARYYLWTSIVAPREMRARVLAGGDLPGAVWIGATELPPGAEAATLRKGSNSLLLRYDKPGRGHFLLADPESSPEWKQTYPLASLWYNRPGVLPFDTRPQTARPAGWYRTTSPPGLRGMTMVIRGKAAAWVDGRPVKLTLTRQRNDGANEYRVALSAPSAAPAVVAIRVEQERGSYAGAAFAEPVAFECGAGTIGAGDWSRIDGLSSYSGGAWYRKSVTLSADQVRRPAWLDLGMVSSSAEIVVNGRHAGVKLSPPYRVEISKFLKTGENRIEVLVYSALSNHYQTIPTRYRGKGASGLIGPVQLLLE